MIQCSYHSLSLSVSQVKVFFKTPDLIGCETPPYQEERRISDDGGSCGSFRRKSYDLALLFDGEGQSNNNYSGSDNLSDTDSEDESVRNTNVLCGNKNYKQTYV